MRVLCRRGEHDDVDLGFNPGVGRHGERATRGSHVWCEFSQQFDPTDTLMQIASDEEKRAYIHAAPDKPVTLQHILKDLWPKLGFLPIDPENPGVALVAEFMLNELILKNSESLEQLDLQHLKELFSGDDDEGEGDDDMEGYDQMEAQDVM